ncbi:Presequence translocated-associated motor subunit PAM17, mitochondrial Flags: Precursor [Serendipita indica DSM 11827]|uniref:Presequence translocated-associated motor subunit PAM17 n=1 Tax=Serendipita indica (strain DSM 11827) TaxID=1109443 RepID=G4T7L5_SERID|nr:Presequence translocated-associated motor subunit PAM17, mitochondrial Flags: Precursor [Serendipita indica DSM 11827]CCA67316.1 related to translocase-associated motor subunit, required for stable complex formation between cochaperones Pam16p and Pam18p [Serendipita indica DSM 11827]
MLVNVRNNSSNSTTSSAHKTPSPETVSAGEILSWCDYLSIRGKKRRWEMATTIPITVTAGAAGAAYFGVNMPQFMGLDPLVMAILGILGTSGLGYLVGPIIGSQIWRLTHRKLLPLIEDKEREFHKHIKRNRVDPSTQSTSNPVPDFYGEKIGSMKDYRQWLRDQARYRRKASWGAATK